MQDLEIKGEYDGTLLADIIEGRLASQAILARADEAIGREHRIEAVGELQSRVEDWKGHRIDHFGDLLLFGCYTVLKGDGAKEVEREVSNIFSLLDPDSRNMVKNATQRSHATACATVMPLAAELLLSLFPPTLEEEPPEERITELPGILEEEEEEQLPSPEDSFEEEIRIQMEKLERMQEKLERTQRSPETPPKSHQPPGVHTPSPQTPGCNSPNVTRLSDTPPMHAPYQRKLLRSAALHPKRKTPYESHTSDEISPKAFHMSGKFEPPQSTYLTSPNSKPRLKRFHDVTRSFPLRMWIAKPTKEPTSEEVLLKPAICHPEYRSKDNGVFKNSTCFLAVPEPVDPMYQKPKSAVAQEEEKIADPTIEPTKLEKQVIESLEIDSPVREQYKVYLFERILLCCKEINPNKSKNKMLGTNKPLVDKKGKLKLQLKGRIFMQNVTDVVTVKRAGLMTRKTIKNDQRTDSSLEHQSYTIQIFWKGDPGVENFVIRFNDEATMKKWQEAVQRQKKILTESARGSGQTGTSATEFSSLRNQPKIENPYRADDEDDDDEGHSYQNVGHSKSHFNVSRNGSSTSLRSVAGPSGRLPPAKFPQQEHVGGMFTPALSLNTNVPPGGPSPGEFPGNSYFSPSNDSPISTRSSSQQSMYPFSRSQTPGGGWTNEELKHRTAPAMVRAPSRDGTGPPNSYVLNGRTVTRPSLPVMAGSQYTQQQLQSRLRSASTPDIHNPNVPGERRQGNSQLPTPSDEVPVPPIPAHVVQMRAPINRSQTSSPVEPPMAMRNHDRHGQRVPPTSDPYSDGPVLYNQHDSMNSNQDGQDGGIPYPPQLKVSIWFDPDPSHVTIVVPIIIKHQSLIDRIDSKMVKLSPTSSIAKGSARLRYKDSDGDIVTIRSDEDVHLALEDWGMANEDLLREGHPPDFKLYWQQC